MAYRDLRDFIAQLEQLGELKRVSASVSPHLEMTALCDRALRANGPALLFEQPTGHGMPVLGNLFGTTARVNRFVFRRNTATPQGTSAATPAAGRSAGPVSSPAP